MSILDEFQPLPDNLAPPRTRIRRTKNELAGATITESQYKIAARHDRRDNLTLERIKIYDWIDNIQRQLKLNNYDFAMLFNDILRDPVQAFKTYRTRNGVMPSDRTMAKLRELERTVPYVIIKCEQFIYFDVKDGTVLKLYWDDTERIFRMDRTNPHRLTKGEKYVQTVERFRNQNCLS